MSFPVRLQAFEGPLDLLLQLVSRERVDVADISIQIITSEFLAAIEGMGVLDLDAASSFLVLAATLVELKSLKLLPRDESDPEAAGLLEERDRLLQRLVEYATFKAAAGGIAGLLAAGEGYYNREAAVPEELRTAVPDPLGGVSPAQFWAIAASVFLPRARRPAPGVDTSYIAPIRVSLAEMIELLADEVRRRRLTSFLDLCGSGAGRADVVVRFLALLELFRQQSVELEQADPFGGITVRWRQPYLGPEALAPAGAPS